MKSTPLSVWTPHSQAEPGGIPVFTRSLLEALRRAIPGATLTVYAPGRTSAPALPSSTPEDFKLRGNGKCPAPLRGLAFFLRLLLDSLLRRPGLVVLTDVRFAPTAALLKKLLRIPFAVIAHGPDILNLPDNRATRALEDADLVLADSAYARDHLRGIIGLSIETTAVLHPLFEPESFIPGAKPPYLLSRYDLAPDQHLILTIARHFTSDTAQACEQIIEALPRIRKSIPDIHCLVCGYLHEDEAAKIAAMLRYFHLEDCVTLSDAFPEDERCDHYNLADLVAMPSKSEGFLMPHLEAMACGTPVLAGDKDGSVDSLLGGDLGILVNPDSPDRIGDAAVDVLTGGSELSLLYRPGEMRKQVLTNFGFERFVENLVSHLDHLGLDTALVPLPQEPDPGDPSPPTPDEAAPTPAHAA